MSTQLQIKQSTFDDVVKENLVDLGMSPDEAIQEASEQFKSQGVNLNGIVTNPCIEPDGDTYKVVHPVLESLTSLQQLIDEDPLDVGKINLELSVVATECAKDWAHRNLASFHGAFPLLVTCWQKMANETENMKTAVYDSLEALVTGHPDLFTPESMQLVCDALRDKGSSPAECRRLLRLVQLAGVKHEANRQLLVEKGVVGLIVTAVTHNRTDGAVVQRGCAALRTLTLDDDIRAEFGKAHEHAKLIVVEHGGINVLAELLREHRGGVDVASEILLTLCKLVVRYEFCKEVVEIGVLTEVVQTLAVNMKNQALVRSILLLLKSLAGNDEVKDEIVKVGAAELVVEAMMQHLTQPSIAEAGCAALASLALRCPSHCPDIMMAGGGAAIVHAMEQHPGEANVQKQACMAIRNLVARNRDQCPQFLEAGAEALIRRAREAFTNLEDEAKAALRDLGCQVDLKELWTGKKGSLQN